MTREIFPDPEFERQLADFLDDDIWAKVKKVPTDQDFVPANPEAYGASSDELEYQLSVEDEHFSEELEACVDGTTIGQLLEERAEEAEETCRAREFDVSALDEFKEFLERKEYNYKVAVVIISSSAPSTRAIIEFHKILDLDVFRSVEGLILDGKKDEAQPYLKYFSNPAIANKVHEIYDLGLGAEYVKTKQWPSLSLPITETVTEKELLEMTDEEFLFCLMKKERFVSSYFHFNYLDIMQGPSSAGQSEVYSRNADLIDEANSMLKVEAVDRAHKLREAGNLLFRNAAVVDRPVLVTAFDKDVYDQATFTFRSDDESKPVLNIAEEADAIVEEFASNDDTAALMREGLNDCLFSACQNAMKLGVENIKDIETAIRRYASNFRVRDKMLRVLGFV